MVDVVAHADAVDVLIECRVQVAVVVNQVVVDDDVVHHAGAGVRHTVGHLPVEDAEAAVCGRAMHVVVANNDMARGQQNGNSPRCREIGCGPELDVLDDPVRAGDLPSSADERTARAAHAADVDGSRAGSLRHDRGGARVRGVVRAVQFNDRPGRKLRRNRLPRPGRRAVRVAAVSGRGLRRVHVVEAGGRDGPGIRRGGRDLVNAKRRSGDADWRRPRCGCGANGRRVHECTSQKKASKIGHSDSPRQAGCQNHAIE